MMKKIIALLLLTSTLSLFSCGDKEQATQNASGAANSVTDEIFVDEEDEGAQVAGLEYTDGDILLRYPCILAGFDTTKINNVIKSRCVDDLLNKKSAPALKSTYQITFFNDDMLSFLLNVENFEINGEKIQNGMVAFCLDLQTGEDIPLSRYVELSDKNVSFMKDTYKTKYNAESPAINDNVPYYIVDASVLGLVFNNKEFIEITLNSLS